MNVIRGKIHRAQRVVIYGQEGVGKSTLAAGFPSPIFLDTEAGSHQLDVDRVPVECLADLEQALYEITEAAAQRNCQWQTVVIDTADQLWNLCARAECEENNWRSIEAPGYGKGYAQASERFISLLARLNDLMRFGVGVVVICHAEIQRINPPDGEEYSKYAIKVNAPSTQAKTAKDKLKEWCDVLLFCRFDVAVRRDKTDQKPGKAVSSERVIQTASAPAWEAKNRLGLPDSLPMEASALAAIWGGANGAPRTNPAENGTATPQAAHEALALTDEDRALLTEYFVGIGKLAEGQTLADLPANVASALKARAKNALEKAEAWKREQEGGAE